MRAPVASLIGLALLGSAAGCRCFDRGKLERELRAREEDVRHLREELERSEAYNHGLFHDLRGGGCAPPGVEHTVGMSPVRSLALGRQTGGLNDGSCSGDDSLQVQVEPRDPDGHAVKVAGSLIVQLMEIDKQGLKKPLSTWEVGPDQLRRSWKSGLLSSGYVLTFPWKVWPTTEKLRVVAHFKPVDGRVFEAEKDITVRLPPLDQRRTLPVPPGPPPATEGETLPPPRPLGPGPAEISGPVLGGEAAEASSAATLWRPVAAPPPAELMRPTPTP